MTDILTIGLTTTYEVPGYDTVLDSECKRVLRERATGLETKFYRAPWADKWTGWPVATWAHMSRALGTHASRTARRGSAEWTARWRELEAYALGTKPTPLADIVAVRDIQAEMRRDERRTETARELAAAMNEALSSRNGV